MAGEIGFEALEQALVREAQAFAYPPTPTLAGRVRAQLEAERRQPQPAVRAGRRLAWPALALRPALLVLLALVIAGLALLAVSPEARTAFAGWLGGLRNLRIIFVPPTPIPTPTPTAINTTTPGPSATPRPTPTATPTPGIVGLTTLAEAQRMARFPIGLPHYPPGLSEPERVYAQDIFYGAGQQVILVYGAGPGTPAAEGKALFTLYELQLQPRELIEKMVGMQTVVEEVQVNGTPAVWLAGAAHMVQIRRANGDLDYESQRTVSGNTLAWEIGDVTYRLETVLPQEEAIRIAESVTILPSTPTQPVSLTPTSPLAPAPQVPVTATPLP